MMYLKRGATMLLVSALPLIVGCQESNAVQEASPTLENQMNPANPDAPNEGIAVPAAVRDNLGITFATVEKRSVVGTRRVPGEFELLPTARQEFHALLPGRVDLKVAQFQAVEAGALLFTIDSPQWRQIQHEAVEAAGDITMAEAALQVARAQRQEAAQTLAKLDERIANLNAAGARNAQLETDAAASRSGMPRHDAEVRAAEAYLREAEEHYASRLAILASVTGQSPEVLDARDSGDPAWRSIQAIEVRSTHAGVVEQIVISPGGWVEVGELVITTMDPTAIRFHAHAPQSDVTLFADGQQGFILPQQGGSVSADSSMGGSIQTGLALHEDSRSLSLYVVPGRLEPWAKPGVSGYLEVITDPAASVRLAVPSASVIQDGLQYVLFRRNPKNPDEVLRRVADVGQNDGRWVEIRSGLIEGDEVVLEGVYSLKLSSSNRKAPDGYHYHADGALHKNH